MTNKATKRALLMSALALMLCVSMLVGTTYAWFTDSVTSTNNIIKSGNLDVNLYYWDNSMPTGTQVSIEDEPELKLFRNVNGEQILWEPGATGFGQFEVANEGTLALKYQLKLEFYNATATAEGKTLADVLSVYAIARIKDNEKMADPELQYLLDNYGDSTIPGYEAQPLTDFILEGYLLPGESFRYELGAFWEPTANDNDYNVEGGLSIDFGVTLFATQMTYEEDSYDDQYDKDAYLPIVYTAGELASAIADGTDVKLGADITLDGVTALSSDLDLGGYTLTANLLVADDATAVISNGKLVNQSAANSAIESTGNLTLNNVEVASTRHAVRIEGGTATINGGTYKTAEYAGRTQHALNVSDGAVVTVNGGTFIGPKGTDADSGAAVNVQADSTVIINGGNFSKGKNNTLSSEGTLTVYGGTFDQDPSAYLAAGFKATETEGVWTVSATEVENATDLQAALNKGESVVLNSDITVPDSATESNAYGATGVNVKNGQTFDGNGNSFGVNKWGTWDSAISTTGGIIKNVTINSGMRGIFVNHNSTESSKVILENVTIDGTVYTISCDQGTNHGLTATNSTFNGWTSYAATIGDVEFINCSFGEGQGYNFSRPYAPTTYVRCNFEAGHEIDPRAAVTFENCTIDGVALTADNLATLVTGNIANATVK